MSLPRLMAPQDDGHYLIHPPPNRVEEIVEANRKRPDRLPAPLAAIRRAAAAEAIALARAYLAGHGEPAADSGSASLFLAGHQPELFHPGVWFKNFALSALARRHAATALNLIVDNDVLKSTTLRIPKPSTDPADVALSQLAFDGAAGATILEERRIDDPSLFASFPSRLAAMIDGWPFRPLATSDWPTPDGNRPLGEQLAAFRRSLERRWGCRNLELPLSRLCATESFARFALYLIDDLPLAQEHYNTAVRDYRRRNRIYSEFHPVPDLSRDGDWLEAPFWAWRHGQSRRSRLFVARSGGRLRLRVAGEQWPDLAIDAAEEWLKLEKAGFKVRTRALTTTLFARLCLGDLFLHGIGGGKYDEVTDSIISRLLGIEPPQYLVVTGTLRLPFSAFAATEADTRRAHRRLRDLQWNPQRELPPDSGENLKLARLFATRPAETRLRRHWFESIREAKADLRAGAEPRIRAAEVEVHRLDAEVEANRILQRRDYSFVLYPEQQLRGFLTAEIGT